MFWLKHPEHGEMPVCDRGEVERVAKFGWVLVNEGPEPIRSVPEQAVEEFVPAEDAPLPEEAPIKRKPGRPRKAQ